jgi:Tfp pilus assembly protein PilN
MSLTLRRPTDDAPDVDAPAKEPRQKPAKKAKPAPTPKAAKSVSRDRLEIGGEPRVDLLPPEVRAQRRASSTRRALGWGILATVLVVALVTGGAMALSIGAQASLVTAQAETGTLLAQQARYLGVRQVQDQVALATAAQKVGVSTEIDWKTYLESVQATLPANVAISTVTIDSATPMALYVQPTVPLQGARVATVSFSATSPTLPQVPAWLLALAKLKGFTDATPGSVTLDPSTNIYTANITMHINEDAFDKRFNAEGK